LRRRDWLLIFLASLLLFQLYGVTKSGADASSSGDDWPMFLHDPAHIGQTASAGSSEPVVLWSYNASDYASFSVFSAAVVNGIVYAGSGGNIYAFDAYTGDKIWNYTTQEGVTSSPAVSENTLFIGTERYILALKAFTGTKTWSFATEVRVDSSPIVADGVVYVGSFDGNVYALDTTTGDKIWNYTTGDEVFSSPSFANGRVFVGSIDASVYAFNASTGTEIWNYSFPPAGYYMLSSPAISGGVVYAGNGHALYAFGTPRPTPTPSQQASLSDLHLTVIAVVAVTLILTSLLLVFKIRRKGPKNPPPV
jgi:outer membrane protein assembly factor BamB